MFLNETGIVPVSYGWWCDWDDLVLNLQCWLKEFAISRLHPIVAAMSPVNIGNYIGLIVGVTGATAVSFLISAFILRRDKGTGDELAASEAKMKSMKAEAKGQDVAAAKDVMSQAKGIKQIIFACDAGMGSSAMGASILRDKVKKAGLDLSVTNTAISNLQDKPDS